MLWRIGLHLHVTSRDGTLEIAMGFSGNQSVDNCGICYSGSSLVTGIHGLCPSRMEVLITLFLRASQMTVSAVSLSGACPVLTQPPHPKPSPFPGIHSSRVQLKDNFPLTQGTSAGPSQLWGPTRYRQTLGWPHLTATSSSKPESTMTAHRPDLACCLFLCDPWAKNGFYIFRGLKKKSKGGDTL